MNGKFQKPAIARQLRRAVSLRGREFTQQVKRIAKRNKIGESTVYGWIAELREHGRLVLRIPRGDSHHNRRRARRRIPHVLSCLCAGHSIRETARMLHVSHASVYRSLHALPKAEERAAFDYVHAQSKAARAERRLEALLGSRDRAREALAAIAEEKGGRVCQEMM